MALVFRPAFKIDAVGVHCVRHVHPIAIEKSKCGCCRCQYYECDIEQLSTENPVQLYAGTSSAGGSLQPNFFPAALDLHSTMMRSGYIMVVVSVVLEGYE